LRLFGNGGNEAIGRCQEGFLVLREPGRMSGWEKMVSRAWRAGHNILILFDIF
jgi:hypothetical protein